MNRHILNTNLPLPSAMMEVKQISNMSSTTTTQNRKEREKKGEGMGKEG
jgi:hypothetical protein